MSPDPQRFHMLTVLRSFTRDGRRIFVCRCDCGSEKEIRASHVKAGRIKSCGCNQNAGHASRTHGMSRTPEYNIWNNMKRRCHSPKDKRYSYYGGRGISVCSGWRDSFDQFYADMGPRPSPSHSIDRINNNGNYEPSNCRWATALVQANNKRDNRRVVYHGKDMTVSEAARLSGVVPASLAAARMRLGWSTEEALETPRSLENS